MSQLNFEFLLPTHYTRENLAIGLSNESAYGMLNNKLLWTHHFALLIGGESSGKTHHSHIWAEEHSAKIIKYADLNAGDIDALLSHGALVVEDIHEKNGNENTLFHLINLVLQTGAYLLLTSRKPASDIGIVLPDLLSRLRMALPIFIDPPGDDILRDVFWKLLEDRQLDINPNFAELILERISRDITSLQKIVNGLEEIISDTGKSIKKDQILSLIEKTTNFY